MPVGVRQGPADDQPKALADAFVSPSSTNARPRAGSFLAVFFFLFPMFTLVTVQYLQRESYTSDVEEEG